jgi:hypothetical protein
VTAWVAKETIFASDVYAERKRQKSAGGAQPAGSFPEITLNAAAAWYSFTALSSAVETLHLL